MSQPLMDTNVTNETYDDAWFEVTIHKDVKTEAACRRRRRATKRKSSWIQHHNNAPSTPLDMPPHILSTNYKLFKSNLCKEFLSAHYNFVNNYDDRTRFLKSAESTSMPPHIQSIEDDLFFNYGLFQNNLFKSSLSANNVANNSDERIQILESELTDAKQQIKDLEVSAERLKAERKHYKKALKLAKAECEDNKKALNLAKAECEDNKKALNLAKAEAVLLGKSVSSSLDELDVLEPNLIHPHIDAQHLDAIGSQAAGVYNFEEVRGIHGTLHERLLKLEVETQWMRMDRCQAQNTLHQMKLNDENRKLNTELERQLGMLRKHLKEQNADIQDMESLDCVLLVKEQRSNDELQEAWKELLNGLHDIPHDRPLIGIKRMGELNLKPFQDVCMKKFPCDDWRMKSDELCSFWQKSIESSEWFPFKTIQIDGKHTEIVDDSDDKLKQLKDAWGDQVYNAVCTALSEVNEYNPSGRWPLPELWNFKESKKASLKEVIEYLLKRLEELKKSKQRGL